MVRRGMGLGILALQFLVTGGIVPGAVAAGQQQNVTEDQVKAAYLLNFAKLGEWPRFALPEGPSALVIGVSGASGGEEEFVNVLKATVAGKAAGTHMLVVRAVGSDTEMKS